MPQVSPSLLLPFIVGEPHTEPSLTLNLPAKVPHFAQPFEFNNKGVVKTVEQDSEQDILDCVLRICLCPEGFREDQPEFGLPELAFQTIPLDLKAVEEAIERFEPRCTTQIVERAMSEIEQGSREVQIEVTP